jgi:hypothetical protein
MAFSGDMVHAAFLSRVQSIAPEVSQWLHDGNKRRFFTCSSLQFPYATARMRDAEYRNVHLPLEPEKVYSVRITLLLGELFPLLYETWTRFSTQAGANENEGEPFMRLGKQSFRLQEVVMEGDASGWTGSSSFSMLVEAVRQAKINNPEPLAIEFASLTTFNRGNLRNKIYGGYHALLPLPQYIFPTLAQRWQELAPAALAEVVQPERIEQYIQNDGIIISDYDLRPHFVTFTAHTQRGFVGTCKYLLRGPDEATTEQAPLSVRQQILLLARFAFYSGVGHKSAMGLGQVRIR